MAFQKRKSDTYQKALKRLAGLNSISNSLDLGHGLTNAAYEESIAALQAKINTYNTSLASADAMRDEIGKAEKALGALSEKMLLAVAVKYGRNSEEYKRAGGKLRVISRTPSVIALNVQADTE